MLQGSTFNIGEKVVYPSHGVGEIIDIEKQFITGIEIKVYVISFPQDKMMLRVPISRALASGLRPLTDKCHIQQIYVILKSRPKAGNKMWSRRAQEYETKINSGDIIAITEVVRDLFKNVNTDRSYSERTIYESALNRLVSELSMLEGLEPKDATEKLLEILREKTVAA